MTRDTTDLVKRVGIWAGAAIAVATCVAWAWSLIISVTIVPRLEEAVAPILYRVEVLARTDTTIIRRMEAFEVRRNDDMDDVAEALKHSIGSSERDKFLKRVNHR